MVGSGETRLDQSNSECLGRYSGSQQAGAKLRRAQGKQPMIVN